MFLGLKNALDVRVVDAREAAKKERKNLRKERGKQVNFLIMLLNYVTWDTPRGETLTPTHQMRGYQLRVERTTSVSFKIPSSFSPPLPSNVNIYSASVRQPATPRGPGPS